jgi:hypothetical protein
MPASYFEGGFGSVPDAMIAYLKQQGLFLQFNVKSNA